jgi:hypothetical protein
MFAEKVHFLTRVVTGPSNLIIRFVSKSQKVHFFLGHPVYLCSRLIIFLNYPYRGNFEKFLEWVPSAKLSPLIHLCMLTMWVYYCQNIYVLIET